MKERDKEGVTMIFKVRKLFSLFNAFCKYLIVLERHGRIWQEQSWQNNKWLNTDIIPSWWLDKYWYWYCDRWWHDDFWSFSTTWEGNGTSHRSLKGERQPSLSSPWTMTPGSHICQRRMVRLPLCPSHFDIPLQGKIWTFEQTQWHFCWVHLIPIIAFLVSLANPMTGDPTFQRLVLATQLVDGQVNTFFVDTTWMRFVSEIWMFLATQLVNK